MSPLRQHPIPSDLAPAVRRRHGHTRGAPIVQRLRSIGRVAEPGKAVTGVAATDIFTSTAHGYLAGEEVKFSSLTGGAGIVAGTSYFVIAANLAANTFQVSATPGGAALNFTTDLTAGTVARQALQYYELL